MSSDVLGALQVGFSGRIVRIEKLRVVNNCRILFISNIGCSRKNLKASDIFLMQIKITIFSQKAKFILFWKKGEWERVPQIRFSRILAFAKMESLLCCKKNQSSFGSLSLSKLTLIFRTRGGT